MANTGTLSAHSSIESVLRGRTRPALKLAGHEQAMARRLAQLQTALGAEAPGDTPQAKSPQPAASWSFKLTSLILISLTSAMVGAGAIRLALATNAPAVEQPKVPAPAAPMSAAPAQTAPLVAAKEADQAQIEGLLESWRQAWQTRNLAGYLDAYGTAFKPFDGSSRENWVAARTKKLATGAAIEIQVKDVIVERIDPDLFKVSFRQDYASGSYREAGRAKTLHIAREDSGWKIVREQQD